jgi:hypothetical protein
MAHEANIIVSHLRGLLRNVGSHHGQPAPVRWSVELERRTCGPVVRACSARPLSRRLSIVARARKLEVCRLFGVESESACDRCGSRAGLRAPNLVAVDLPVGPPSHSAADQCATSRPYGNRPVICVAGASLDPHVRRVSIQTIALESRPLMSPRFIAFFLSVVMSCSNLVAQGHSIGIAGAAQEQTAPSAAAHDGSMDDASLGDLLAQAEAETSADLVALVAPGPAAPCRPSSAGLWPRSVAALATPYLDAPRRPPRAGRSAA